MFDVVSIVIGVIIGIVVLFIIITFIDEVRRVPQIKLDGTIENKPYCPECFSYDLRLVDISDGVPWLQGHIKETDYYECQRCKAVFSDGD